MYRGVVFDGIEYRCKIWRKSHMCFCTSVQISPEHGRKFKNFEFDGILLSKVENVWASNLSG